MKTLLFLEKTKVSLPMVALVMFTYWVGFMSGMGNDSNAAAVSTTMPIAVNSSINFGAPTVSINEKGDTHLRGRIASISGANLSVKSWGGTWNVDISSASLMAKGGIKIDYASAMALVDRNGLQADLSALVGDVVTVNGTTLDSAPWSIKATRVQDESTTATTFSGSGTIANLTTSGFTLMSKEYFPPRPSSSQNGAVGATPIAPLSIRVVADTKITLNNNPATLADLKNDMSVAVSGLMVNGKSIVYAIRVSATAPQLPVVTGSGVISNLNLNSGTFMVSGGGTTFMVKVTDNTVITLNGKPAKLGDLANGMAGTGSGQLTGNTILATKLSVVSSTNSQGSVR